MDKNKHQFSAQFLLNLFRPPTLHPTNLEHNVSRRSSDLGDEEIVDEQFVGEREALEGEEFTVERHSLRRRIVAHFEQDVVDPELDGRTLEPNGEVTTADDGLTSHFPDAVN